MSDERLPDEVRELLDGFEGRDVPLASLSTERLRELTEQHGIDSATALLYERILHTEPHSGWNRRLAAWTNAGSNDLPRLPATLVIVPGAFWREYPATGAGGESLEEPARRLGMEVERVPVASQGRLDENAQTILAWLRRSRAEHVVLVSLSKGGADVRAALATPGAREAFARVRAWVDLSGIVSGTPMVEWFAARPLRRLLLGLVLRLKGHDPGFLTELGRPRAVFPEVPEDLRILHLAGLALRRHCTTSKSRRWWKRLASGGPTDGVVRLADVTALPGIVVPIWGADHYLRPLVQDSRFALAVLSTLAEDLRLPVTASTRSGSVAGEPG